MHIQRLCGTPRSTKTNVREDTVKKRAAGRSLHYSNIMDKCQLIRRWERGVRSTIGGERKRGGGLKKEVQV